MDIVTADGQLRTASADENADLFWAVRGGGGNFGVVTSFEYQLHPVAPTVLAGLLIWPRAMAHDVLRAYREFSRTHLRMPARMPGSAPRPTVYRSWSSSASIMDRLKKAKRCSRRCAGWGHPLPT